MKKIFLIIILFLASIVSAQEADVIKDVPSTINFLDILDVNIIITNPGDAKKFYELIETIPQGFQLIDPSQPDAIEQHNALPVKLYKWNVEIEPKKMFTLNYKVKPGYVGEYIIPPTKIRDLTTNTVMLSESKKVTVLCIPDNKCKGNENVINCPEDCFGGLSDGICDYKSDGICDPDCEDEPDCKTTSNLYIYVIVIFVIILLVFIVIRLTNAKKDRNLGNQED